MKAKINKALDYNGLLNDQKQGKRTSIQLEFPLIVAIKYDGNYTVTEVREGKITHYTSGGLVYTHTDDGAECFDTARDGYYLAERIFGEGKLGERNKCNLRGPKIAQTSTGHTYKVFDILSIGEYEAGGSTLTYIQRYKRLLASGVAKGSIVDHVVAHDRKSLQGILNRTVTSGYEGIMLIDHSWKWKSHPTRRAINFCKYKPRPTADLLCIDVKEGEGKYRGLIGSLLLVDSQGREVYVGSGMSDYDRAQKAEYFIGKVCEVEYEQIVHTYIQATHPPLNEGVLIRWDKTSSDID